LARAARELAARRGQLVPESKYDASLNRFKVGSDEGFLMSAECARANDFGSPA
jgi:hypothetical protein